MKFCPIASGSNGNCIYLGSNDTHILIDAGLSGRRIESGLASISVKAAALDAIFVTHEHTDHIQGLGVISRRFDIPIYATPKTWRFFDRHNSIGKIALKNRKFIEPDTSATIKDICITPFSILHDSAEPVGYVVKNDKYKISIATDMGFVTDSVKHHIADSDLMLIESNHDEEMLINGSYPQALKQRVLSKKGHLSNAATGILLAEIMCSRLKHVYLGHLSAENNRPLIALNTVTNILKSNKINVGKDLQLQIAIRGGVSDPICL